MAHEQQRLFLDKVKSLFPDFFTHKKILDIGSLNINGTARPWFENCTYIGVDVGDGKDVDIVCEGQNLDHADNFYDVTVSCECFEHNPYWLETFRNMHRMLKPNGLMIMTCATTGRREHGTNKRKPKSSPLTIKKGWEYYKNLTENDFRDVMDIDSMFKDYEFSIETKSCDLYFYGFKK